MYEVDLKSQFAVCLHRARSVGALAVALDARDRVYACEPVWIGDENETIRNTQFECIVLSIGMGWLLNHPVADGRASGLARI